MSEDRRTNLSNGLKAWSARKYAHTDKEVCSTVVTLLLVEQNLALVKRVAKEITVMDQGKSIFHGDVKNLDNEDFVQKHLSLGVKH